MRQPEPRIIDPQTHPQKWVSFTVAADFLDMDRRSLALWAAQGHIRSEFRGRWRKIHIDEAVRFKTWLRRYAASL